MRFLLRTVEPFKIVLPRLAQGAAGRVVVCRNQARAGDRDKASRGANSSSEATVVKAPWRKHHIERLREKPLPAGTNGLISSIDLVDWRVGTT
jgi:hypothetical protein